MTLDLSSAADMFVGPTAPRWRATSAARRTVRRPHGLDPRGGPVVTLDLDSAADMFVGLDPRGTAVTLDLETRRTCSLAPRRRATSAARALGSAADMFVGLDVPGHFIHVILGRDPSGVWAVA